MGGADKGLDTSNLLKEVYECTKKVYMLSGTGTERVRGALREAPIFDSLKECIDAAFTEAIPGDVVLFSPAFASFGMFRNEYERNDQFMALVKSYL